MNEAQLEFGDVYICYDEISSLHGFAKGKLSVRQSTVVGREKEDTWINFGDNLKVCLSPSAILVLTAKIRSRRLRYARSKHD